MVIIGLLLQALDTGVVEARSAGLSDDNITITDWNEPLGCVTQ